MAYYHLYELNHAAVTPVRFMTQAIKDSLNLPFHPLKYTGFGRAAVASCEVFERATRRYGKPEFGVSSTIQDGKTISIKERVLWSAPFCTLRHFERDPISEALPRILLVAPLSGHYATLLRRTVQALLPHANVFVTDWIDARAVLAGDDDFSFDDYVSYVIEILRVLGEQTHVIAVCQPAVPVLAAVSLMSEDEDPARPLSMTLMGGPIDTRINPTQVNEFATTRGLRWFENNVIMRVPFPHVGALRKVYPGFLQLSGFMSMNFDRHVSAHNEFFSHLVTGDGDSAEKHRSFYDEYLAVMDLPATFFLESVEKVFIDQRLARGNLTCNGRKVRPEFIRDVALFTVEGERDDISGPGQTEAAHRICPGIPESAKRHLLQSAVGHYGVFNGRTFQREIGPKILEFCAAHRDRKSLKRSGGKSSPRATGRRKKKVSRGRLPSG